VPSPDEASVWGSLGLLPQETCHDAAARLAADWVALAQQVERIDGAEALNHDNENNRSVP